MGTSTDAILAYGFDLGEDCPWDNEKFDNFEEWISDLLNISPPDEEFDQEDKEILTKYHLYWDNQREAIKNLDVLIDFHCSGDYPMYAVVITESQKIARRGYSQKIESLKIDLNWNDKIKKFCQLTEIEYQKPSWVLYSLWI